MTTVEFQVQSDIETLANNVGAICSEKDMCRFIDVMFATFAAKHDYEKENVNSAAEALKQQIHKTQLELIN